ECLTQFVSLYQPQMSCAAEIVELSNLFFNEHSVLDDAAKEFLQGETVATVLHAFKEQLEALNVFDVPSISVPIKD
ncbi:glutamate--tRNA ligase, partial [Enterococcus faecalis]